MRIFLWEYYPLWISYRQISKVFAVKIVRQICLEGENLTYGITLAFDVWLWPKQLGLITLAYVVYRFILSSKLNIFGAEFVKEKNLTYKKEKVIVLSTKKATNNEFVIFPSARLFEKKTYFLKSSGVMAERTLSIDFRMRCNSKEKNRKTRGGNRQLTLLFEDIPK